MDVTAHPPVNPDRRNTAARDQLLRRIREEFEEMPCLSADVRTGAASLWIADRRLSTRARRIGPGAHPDVWAG